MKFEPRSHASAGGSKSRLVKLRTQRRKDRSIDWTDRKAMADDNEPLLPTTGSAAAAGVGTRRISQQHVELNENLASAVFSSKRKRPGAAGEELAGAGAGAVGESAADASLESSRLKRRNGAGALEGGGGGMEKGTWGGKVLAGGPGVSSSPVEGAQTRKRKSLEKLAAVAGAAAAEDDGGSVSPSREVVKISTNSSSSKKRKPAVGDEAVYGMKDGPEPSDEGRVSQGMSVVSSFLLPLVGRSILGFTFHFSWFCVPKPSFISSVISRWSVSQGRVW